MNLSSIPYKFQYVWGENATSGFVTNPIPATTAAPAASQSLGFPPATSTPIAAGGTPPNIDDFNGAYQYVTSWLQWYQAGGVMVPYDATFQTSIGGYPNGAIIQSAANIGKFWMSVVDNNTSDPDTGGANWSEWPLVSAQFFLASGNFTVPSGVYQVEVMVVGGGGGGSPASAVGTTPGSNNSSGSGGGAGGLAWGIFPVTPGQVISVTIGTGGVSQTDGTASSFGSFATANGGKAGFFSTLLVSAGGAGGAAQIFSGVTIAAISGGYGSDGQSGAFTGMGNGAAGPWGGQGRAYAGGNTTTPANADGPGAGGGGCYASISGSNVGGQGGTGIVIVKW